MADGRAINVRTNASTVHTALRDARIELDPADRVVPSRDSALHDGLVVSIQRALPVFVYVDGQERLVRTQAATVGEVVAEAGIELGPDDVILVEGDDVDPTDPLVRTEAPRVAAVQTTALGRFSPSARSAPYEANAAGGPVKVVIKRAVPVTVYDGNLPITINTAASTVGEALHKAGIGIYLADIVRPDLKSAVEPGMQVYIERSKAVTIISDDPELTPQGSFVTRTTRATLGEVLEDEGIVLTGREEVTPSLDSAVHHGIEVRIRRFHPVSIEVDGQVISTKTKRATVRELLADEKISLGPADRVEPGLDAVPEDGTVVTITRVENVVVEEEEPIPYESLGWQPDPELELDTTAYQPGEPGVLKRKVNVTYENGQPVDRQVLEEWVESEPVPEINWYGTKIVLREIETPEGTFTYWRKLDVLATHYYDSGGGKPVGHPQYGITRTGTRTGWGTMAVDPNVIPLWTQAYVPGYGVATALDTGGGVRGKHIDLWYPEGDSRWGVRYPTIYLLTPVPAWYPERLP